MLPRDLANGSRSSDPAHPVVVGVDGSFVAIRAARWTAAVAVKFGASLHIANARLSLGHNPSDAIVASRVTEMELQHVLLCFVANEPLVSRSRSYSVEVGLSRAVGPSVGCQ